MTQHLRKLIMSFAVSAFLFGALSVQTNAQELNKVWERSDRTGAADVLPSWYTASAVRGIAEYNGKLYVPDRANSAIQVMDATTGADITLDTPFNLADVSGGLFPMNDLNVSDDGLIFTGNLELNASTGAFKFYWWNNAGGDTLGSYAFTTTEARRLGDRMTVVGSLADNTIEVWVSATTGAATPGVVYVLTTADNGATWASEEIVLSGAASAIGSGSDVMPLAAGRTSDFYVASNSSKPARYTSAGEYVTGSEFSSTSRNGFKLYTVDGSDYMAIYNYRADGTASGNAVGRVIIYDISDATAPTIVAETDLIGDDSHNSGSIVGDVFVRVNEDNSINLYAFDAAHGYVAYTNAVAPYLDAPSNLFFSEYIEGSGNNKALEIKNNTDSTVVLTNYQIAQTNNGSDWKYFQAFADGASIEAGDVYVVITDQVDSELFDSANADEVLPYPSPIHFNGNDARALIHIDATSGDTTFLDIFGETNLDPGSAWDVAGVKNGTANYTLIRKSSVTAGNTTPLGSFGTNYDDSEWIVKSQNIFSNLGMVTEEMETTLSGDYFIPQRSTDDAGFISLHQAFHYVSSLGLSSAVNLYITDDLDETANGLKIDRDDLTESTPLTIKPIAGITPTVEVWGGSGGDGIWINNADYVTIDGSNTIDGDTRDLTITSADTTFSALIYTYATEHTTIANSILTYTGGYNNVSAIVTNESGPTGTSGLSVINNTIGSENGDFANGIGLWGTSSAYAYNSTVMNNRIHATYRGVTTWYSQGNEIVGNTVSIDSPRSDRSRYAGIYAALNFGLTNISGNEIVGLKVNRTETAGYAAGILFNASIDTVVVSNNVIHVDNFENVGAATGNSVYGIAFDNAAGNSYNSVYHNTVRIGTSEETGTHAAFGSHLKTSTAQFWDLKNNIFQVDQDASNANVINWPIDSNANLDADYNNYIAAGTSTNVGLYNATAAVTLAEWKTASDVDDMSTDVEVTFTSATDLSLTGASDGDENLAGMPVELVTTDFSGATRSLTAPYKGAFEGSIALTGPAAPSVGEFSLIAPENFAAIDLLGDSSTVVSFTWEVAESEGDVTYTILVDTLNGDFTNPVVAESSDSTGIKTSASTTFADLDDLLAELEVAQGASIELKWTVVATVGDSSRFANASNTITITRLLGVGTEDEIEKPQAFSLSQNYPNPFNPTSNIRFTLPQANNVRLDVYNINGQLVKTLVNSRMSAGEHTVQFDAGTLASGVYIYRIISGNFVQSKKMTLIK